MINLIILTAYLIPNRSGLKETTEVYLPEWFKYTFLLIIILIIILANYLNKK